MIKSLINATILFAAAGCTNIHLSEKGKSVRLVSNTTDNILKDYSELKTLKASHGKNFRRPVTNIVQCQDSLRNQSAELGADLVVITTQQVGNARCPNCVTLVGTAYRKK